MVPSTQTHLSQTTCIESHGGSMAKPPIETQISRESTHVISLGSPMTSSPSPLTPVPSCLGLTSLSSVRFGDPANISGLVWQGFSVRRKVIRTNQGTAQTCSNNLKYNDHTDTISVECKVALRSKLHVAQCAPVTSRCRG